MKKICIITMIMFVITLNLQCIFASTSVDKAAAGDFWTQAKEFYTKGEKNTDSTLEVAMSPALDVIKDILKTLGTGIFLGSTVILGLRYMFAASEAKADIKESMISLIVASIFFFCAASLKEFSVSIVQVVTTGAGTMQEASQNIFGTAATVGRTLAFAAAIMLGIKYMMSSSDQKADIKKGMLPFVVGIGLVFLTSEVLGYFKNVATDVLRQR